MLKSFIMEIKVCYIGAKTNYKQLKSYARAMNPAILNKASDIAKVYASHKDNPW
jgi:hypothetical protein